MTRWLTVKRITNACFGVGLLVGFLSGTVIADPVRINIDPVYSSLQPKKVGHFKRDDGITNLSVVDMNGDGFVDLVSASRYTVNVELFLQNPDGTFENGIEIFRDEYFTGSGFAWIVPAHLLIRDWNRDGKLDCAIIGNYQKKVFFAIQEDDTHFRKEEIDIDPSSDYNYFWDTTDMNGDGFPDIVITQDDDVGILWGGEDLQFDQTWFRNIFHSDEESKDFDAEATGICARDFDLDGWIDLLVTTNLNFYSILWNEGDERFSESEISSLQPINHFISEFFTTIDLNRDGYLDIYSEDQITGTDSIVWNRGNRTFDYEIVETKTDLIKNSLRVVSDMNRDGYDDLIGLIENSTTDFLKIEFRFGPYLDTFLNIQDFYTEKGTVLGLFCGDYNGDEWSDLAIVLNDPPRILFLYNRGLVPDSPSGYPQTVRVPEDAPTLDEALRVVIPGGVISLKSGSYAEPMRIQNASLTIQGRDGMDRPQMFSNYLPYNVQIENSTVVFNHIETQSSTLLPGAIAVNSNVTFENCLLSGEDQRQTSRYYPPTEAQPAFVWKNAEGRICRLIDTQIIGGAGTNFVDGPGMQILNCNHSYLSLEQSTILGKDGQKNQDPYTPPFPGSVGLLVRDCESLQINMGQNLLLGGRGGDAAKFSIPGPGSPPTHGGSMEGGSGLYIDSSSVLVEGGSICGGDSGNGGDFSYHDYWTYELIDVSFDGARGGDGASILNSSHVTLIDVELSAGVGGVPAGEPGELYTIDETSELVILNSSSIGEWEVY